MSILGICDFRKGYEREGSLLARHRLGSLLYPSWGFTGAILTSLFSQMPLMFVFFLYSHFQAKRVLVLF